MTDSLQRQQALDPYLSFIVQAPAGSGKTELLIQRCLRLLSLVDKPENILAITFTKKAASEMRHRLLLALENAAQDIPPESSHTQATYDLAKAALKQNEKKQWRLLDNPARLKIQTIDAFCAMLTKKMPLLSEFGGQAAVSEDPYLLYQKAIRSMIDELCEKKLDADFSHLFLHLDNNMLRLESLLISLIAKRDHWMRFLGFIADPSSLKIMLEKSFVQIHLELFEQLSDYLHEFDLSSTLLEILCFAAEHVDEDHPIASWKNCLSFPDHCIEEKKRFHAISELLLKKDGGVRKTVDKRQGFPAHEKHMKKVMCDFLENVNSHPPLIKLLQEIVDLPATHYNDYQWQTLLSLFSVLPLALSHLQTVFQTENTVDFIEIALRALTALGNEDNPTDLALYLDYQIHHILIDEFQDTSLIQMTLLNKLTVNWHPDENKTLFLVGDPMQSIYRFRNAEVSLFLQIKKQLCINQVSLEALTLTRNFRSNKQLIDWINTECLRIFSKEENLNTGAVCYTSSEAQKEYADAKIELHFDYRTSQEEALWITKQIISLQHDRPNETIAILVQARSQLLFLIESLQQAHVSFTAVELTSLEREIHIRDLYALTRAILYEYDRIAWLAILRAPWCGLLLDDLLLISENEKKETIWQRINNHDVIRDLSEEGKKRLAHCRQALHLAREARWKKPLHALIKNTWKDLGGLLCLQNSNQQKDCDTYFELIRKLESHYTTLNCDLLEAKLRQLFSKQDSLSSNLHIMTIHKSKGLEFDHVFLPGLEKKPSVPDQAFFLWCERQTALGETDLLLAPIRAYHEEKDPSYDYLNQLEQARLSQEKRRLFYVAITRAKKSLYFTATQKKSLREDSFLSYLVSKDSFIPATLDEETQEEESPEISPALYRLPLSVIESLALKQALITGHNSPSFNWQAPSAKLFGTAFHLILFQLTEMIQTHFNTHTFHLTIQEARLDLIERQMPYWSTLLKQTALIETSHQIKKILHGINTLLTDEKGLWIIAPKDTYHNEYALKTWVDNKLHHIVIDRFFLDEEGTPWIIDYKTSEPGLKNLSDFLAEEKQSYEGQLNHYASVIESLYGKKPRMGLYFPFIPAWIEYS